MKAITLLACLMLVGCIDPVPGEALSAMVQHCLESGKTPSYFYNGTVAKFDCKDNAK